MGIETTYYKQENMHLHSDDWHRTIYIDTLGVATTDFDLPESMQKKLEESGSQGARAYFKWFDKKK